MAELQNSSFLDFAGYQLTSATTVAAAYGLTCTQVAGPQKQVTMALILDRANDPTALLSGDWAQRQTALAALNAAGTLAATYGATPADFSALQAELGGLGIPVLGAADGYVSTAASRTAWVTLDATQFQALFGTPLMIGDLPGGGTLLYWNGNLAPAVGTPLAALWLNEITAPTPSVSVQAVALPNGPQSPGNSATAPGSIYANALGQLYNFPLAGSSVQTGTIGLTEPGVGAAVQVGTDPQTLLDAFRAAAGAPGSGTISGGPVEPTPSGDSSVERAIDVGVAGAASPNSNLILYAGAGPSTYPTYQEAFWGAGAAPAALSSSYELGQLPSPDSPFYAAQQQLFIDAALRNVSVFLDSGDQGSSAGFATGVPQTNLNHSTIYATLVGGTSLSSLASAESDATLDQIVGLALAGDPTTLRQLVAGGLKQMPAGLTSLTPLVETVWNRYTYDAATAKIDSYTVNLTGAGGIDTTTPEPAFQTALGIDSGALDYDGQPGRAEPDVAALAGGNMTYYAPANDLGADPDGTYSGTYYGTSASTPLWAALAAQIQAVFQDVGLPTTGYFNDLLYNAAAISPAAFNDVTIGNNVSSYAFGGPVTDTHSGLPVSPTGLGYSALPGYDLVAGLGSPNGVLLTRSLVAIAEAQLYASGPAVTDPTGAVSQANQTLIVQPTLAGGAGGAGEIDVQAGAAASARHVAAGAPLTWSSQLAQQVLQPDFDGALVRSFDGYAQAAPAEVQAGAGAAVDVHVDGAAATPVGTALTSAYGFADYAGGAGDSVALARPVAVAQTVGGANDQDALVRLRQDGVDQLQLSFYRVDDFEGRIGGLLPGDPGYADAAFRRAYMTSNGSTIISAPGFGNYTEATLTGVNAGDLIASVLGNVTHADMFWGFAAGNELAGGSHVAHLWSYGLNTFGYEDTFGGGDRDYNDAVFQLDFTSLAGHHLVA